MRATVPVPGAWMLWSYGSGAVHGTIGLTRKAARARLADRKANGEAFPGERIRLVRLQVTVRHDGLVEGYLVNGPKFQ